MNYMKSQPKAPIVSQSATLSIFYDGLCPLCSREMNHYKKISGSEKFLFVDITDINFDAVKEGLDPIQVHKVMHVKDAQGKIKTKVDAFIEIWENLPDYNWLAKAAKLSFVRPFLDIGYISFATLRPYLPRKKNDCDKSPYCETKEKK